MSRLDAYSDNSRSLGYVTCECGRERHHGADTCDRCAYLDGCRSAGSIISSLRGTDGLGITELCAVLHIGASSREGVLRSLQRLMQKRRVRRYWRDDRPDVQTKREGWEGKALAGDHGCWIYALDGLTEREWKAA